MTPPFPFDEAKTVAAIALLLQRSARPRSKGELVKLLYLADRAMLLKRGSPITGDTFSALQHGMIVSRTLNLIELMLNGEPSALFEQQFEKAADRDLCLRPPVDLSVLSRAEISTLNATFDEHGTKSFSQLRELTHALPEYIDPAGSSITIGADEILMKEGRPEDEVELVRAKAAQFASTDELFKRIKG